MDTVALLMNVPLEEHFLRKTVEQCSLCWNNRASSKSIAKVVAIAVSQGVSHAVGGSSHAGAQVEVEELAAAIVSAVADASVQVSTSGGSASAKQESVAIAAAAVVAKAVAGATAVTTESKLPSCHNAASLRQETEFFNKLLFDTLLL